MVRTCSSTARHGVPVHAVIGSAIFNSLANVTITILVQAHSRLISSVLTLGPS
jgi:hypothetical protein